MHQHLTKSHHWDNTKYIRPNHPQIIDRELALGDEVHLFPSFGEAVERRKGKWWNKLPQYVKVRIEKGKLDLNVLTKYDIMGKIVRISNSGKIGVEFYDKIWIKEDNHDTGCHGKGKRGHCWYLPPSLVTKRYNLNGEEPYYAEISNKKYDEIISEMRFRDIYNFRQLINYYGIRDFKDLDQKLKNYYNYEKNN